MTRHTHKAAISTRSITVTHTLLTRRLLTIQENKNKNLTATFIANRAPLISITLELNSTNMSYIMIKHHALL